jgi:tetratricopeptide (TPR) repeat protein
VAPRTSRSIAATGRGLGGTVRTRPTKGIAAVLEVLLFPCFAFTLVLAACTGKPDPPERQEADELLQEGLEAHAEGDLETAEELYLEVIRLDPQNQFAYYNLGVIEHGRGELGEAAARYRTAISIDPDFVSALFNLAIVRTELGDAIEAIELYERVIRIEPENAAAHLNLGFVLVDRGSEVRGRRELEEAVRLDPSLADRAEPEASPSPTGD